MKPLVISVDGIDGSGKTTLVMALKEYLEELGHTAVVVPYLGPGLVREAVINEPNLEAFHRMVLLRVAADIAMKQYEEAIANGHFVIADRAVDTFYAYQGYGEGLINSIEPLDKFFERMIVPDVSFLLDISVKKAHERMALRNQAADLFEVRGEDYFERVRNGYLIRQKLFPDRVMLIDASEPQKKVALMAKLHLDWVFESGESEEE